MRQKAPQQFDFITDDRWIRDKPPNGDDRSGCREDRQKSIEGNPCGNQVKLGLFGAPVISQDRGIDVGGQQSQPH